MISLFTVSQTAHILSILNAVMQIFISFQWAIENLLHARIPAGLEQ